MSKNIPIAAAKRIAKDYGYDQVIVYGRDTETGREHMTTYGTSKAKCDAVGKIASTMQKFMNWSGGGVGAFLREIMPAVLRPGIYAGPQGDRSDTDWRADALWGYLLPKQVVANADPLERCPDESDADYICRLLDAARVK